VYTDQQHNNVQITVCKPSPPLCTKLHRRTYSAQ